jgi:arylsulfatase A-like enzyme
MLFRNSFATNGMCSPTRASILTGLMPSQHGVATALTDPPNNKFWPQNWGAIDEFRNMPQTLADAGYDTALIGKFHLGSPLEPKLKFKYWVTFPNGVTSTWFDNEIIDNGKTYVELGNIVNFWTNKAVDYIKHHDRSKPFFLYLAYNGPYGLPPVILKPAGNDFIRLYAGNDMSSMPREPVNRDLLSGLVYLERHAMDNPFYQWAGQYFQDLIWSVNNLEIMQNYAAQISFVDYNVGKVLQALKESGMDDNTLVIYTADQGLAYSQKGFWGQSNNSDPANLYDSTVKVPLIMRHTKHISPMQRTDMMISEYDIFPTILDYAGLGNIKIANTPGKSFAPLLRDETLSWDNHDAIFMEQEATRAIRTQDWKYVKFFDIPREELYNLLTDPGEKVNLAADPKYAQIKKNLNQRLDDFFHRYADPKYDLWQGGTVKSNSDVPDKWKAKNPNWTPVTKLVKPFSG